MPILDFRQERLREEQKELEAKVIKLTAFVETSGYAGLESAEQVRLNLQLFYMQGYLLMLGQRIAAWKHE